MNDPDRSRVALILGVLVAPAMGQGCLVAHALLSPPQPRFVVYYGLEDHPALDKYDVAVLDSEVDSAVLARLAARTKTLGYLSLCEVHMARRWASEVEQQGFLLTFNPKWRDARFIDVRDIRWKARVLNELIPSLLASGFTGLFLDTLDDAAYLEALDRIRFSGMVDAAVNLVLAIRERFPKIPIMVNRGYDLLPRIVAQIDMVLGESVHSTYNTAAGTYVRVSPADIRWQTEQLYEARRLKPGLRLFCLNYWTPNDAPAIAQLYDEARNDDLIPYVATFELNQVVPSS
jgi:polysaccharide biosynthesis protein PelA